MKRAVVFLNMGGPNNLFEVDVFLKNMFNDKNIITVKSNILRSFIANIITYFRGNEAKSNYELIGSKSPLKGYTKKLIYKIAQKRSDEYIVYAMRYTPPFSDVIVDELMDMGIDDILLFPLYPQYSFTTTKSSVDDFYDEVAKHQDYSPNISFIERFYEDESYNNSIINSIVDTLDKDNAEDFHLIFSAHSLPQKIIDAGDTYQNEIIENVGILRFLLSKQNISFASISLAYQSKLGPVQWLEPNLEDKLSEYKRKKVIIYPLSFILDNSETEVELDIEYRKLAKSRCVKEYRVCRCIGEREEFLDVVSGIIDRHYSPLS